jgi:uncharacterized protein (TIRG00374 family)
MNRTLLLKTDKQISRKNVFKSLLGYFIAIACLVWIFHDFEWRIFLDQLKNIQWRFIWLAILMDIISYVSQGWRLQLLIKPIGQLSVLRTTQAVYAGLFTNEILPLRVGELVRPYLISHWLQLKFIRALSSTAMERVMDGIWLAVGVGLTAIFVKLPPDLLEAADVFGIIILIMTGFFVYVVLSKKNNSVIQEKQVKRTDWLQKIIETLSTVFQSLRYIGRTRHFYYALLVSSLVLIFQILAFWLMMHAYGLSFSLWVGAAVLLIEHLGNVVPNAPSNIGTFQFFCILGLSIFGVDKTTATGFSIVVFILLTVPLWIIGLFAISQTGMKIKEIRDDISNVVGH